MSEAWVGRLAECQVLDLAGEAVEVGTLWSERPVVLVLIRHYG